MYYLLFACRAANFTQSLDVEKRSASGGTKHGKQETSSSRRQLAIVYPHLVHTRVSGAMLHGNCAQGSRSLLGVRATPITGGFLASRGRRWIKPPPPPYILKIGGKDKIEFFL